MEKLCPCRSGAEFSQCCQPFIKGETPAPTAEALMRSRYSAFSEGAADYLVETQHKSTRSGRDLADVLKTIRETEWVHLTILETERGQKNDTEGVVEFVAAFKGKPQSLSLLGAPAAMEIGQMHERSTFVREGERWFYVDGEALPAHEPKRNEPCWCGSGKKFKQCHG